MDINELYRILRAGDVSVKEDLFSYLRESFCSFIRHRDIGGDEAEDIVQSALLRISELYENTDIHTSFAGWAHTILKNTLIEHFRKRTMVRKKMTEIAEVQETVELTPVSQLVKETLAECLKELKGHSPTYVRVLNLRYQGYTTAEICEMLGITTNNLYVLLSRARSSLKKCLTKKGAIGG